MDNYKNYLSTYYCIISNNNIIPITNLLEQLFLMIKNIDDNDILLYNKLINKKFINVIEKLNENKSLKEQIIRQIKEIGVVNKFENDRVIKRVINQLLTIIEQFTNKIMNQRNVVSSINLINAEFINDNIVNLGIVNGSSLSKFFTNIEYFKKTSASKTLVLNALINPKMIKNSIKSANSNIINKRYFMKLFRTDMDADIDYKPLLNEIKIYEELFHLVKFNITPHILSKIYTGKILNILEFFDKVSGKQKILDLLHKKSEITGSFLNNEAYMIMTEAGSGTLGELMPILKNNASIPQEIKNKIADEITFQLLYTVYVFSCIHFDHNDLHAGNIFVNELDKPIKLNYKVMGKYYQIETKYFVKIYDFDNSIKYSDVKVYNDKNLFFIKKNKDMKESFLNRFSLYFALQPIRGIKSNIDSKDFMDKSKKIWIDTVFNKKYFDIMSDYWTNNTWFKQFEISPIDEKENLVYTFDDYKFEYTN